MAHCPMYFPPFFFPDLSTVLLGLGMDGPVLKSLALLKVYAHLELLKPPTTSSAFLNIVPINSEVKWAYNQVKQNNVRIAKDLGNNYFLPTRTRLSKFLQAIVPDC